MFHKIKSVVPLPDYRLLVTFTEGCTRICDMQSLFAKHPAFAPLREVPGFFEQVHTDPGGHGVSWNDSIDLDGEAIWANSQPAAQFNGGALVSAEVELPAWLDTLAFQHDLDLSEVLTQALLEKLDIQ